MSEPQPRALSLSRIAAIAGNTFTDLTRQKIFNFVLILALLLIGSSVLMAQLAFQQEFQILKDVSLGAMSIFSSLLAIVATARLLPQEIEDHTIYTILAKPVPRFEYLCGKLSGVLLLLALSLLLMSGLFIVILFAREQILLGETARQLANASPAQLADALQQVRAAGLNFDLIPGVAIIFLKAAVLASLTLFVSTFATTNLFTIVVMVFVYFIGHLQSIAHDYWLHQNSAGWLAHLFLAGVALFFPDLQAFNLVDDIVAGAVIPLTLFLKTAVLGGFYTLMYLLLAVVVFYGKEL